MDRAALDARIDARVDEMVAAGAREEVERAAPAAAPTVRKALGFRELLAGDIEAMKTRTRRYARRQLTWMRKLPNATLIEHWKEPEHQPAAQEAVASFLAQHTPR